ncbi:MAG: DDE-type integrase/transposase/recombinase [Proteobacteria bacterium]|nr:DDE-type integrase/transposase/recombinase [Pseudomonadota bacterium]
MQIIGLHKNIYKLSSYSLSQEKLELHRKKYEKPTRNWERLKSERVTDQTCQEISGISKATYYRYKKHLDQLAKGILPPSKRPTSVRKPQWGESEKQLVLKLRRENPTYGKAKIAVILRRDHGLTLSESTVGRILKYLLHKGLIQKSLSAPRQKRKRRFKGHAQPWKYGMKITKPGQMVQIDHMTISKNAFLAKHFQAWDPISKFIHAGLYSNAKSRTARKFLEELIQKAPFTIESIQVDGGSEFMKEFEEACSELGILLFVLPPKRPQYNGGVERGNRTFREEFYARKDIPFESVYSLRSYLSKSLEKYNSYRPHFSLKGLTPLQYIYDSYPLAA